MDYTNEALGVVTKTITIGEDIEGPVFVYYELENFY